MINDVIEVISKITKLSTDELKNNPDKDNLWESFTHIEIIMELESKYNLRFSEDEIAEMHSINSIVNVLESKLDK